MTTRPLRIALLAHSTNPRGGVVHALAVGDALARLGHEAVVHAPDATGTGFFRPTLCGTVSVPARPLPSAPSDTYTLVKSRIGDYIRYFEAPARRSFDIYHAQDGISGNALASLKASGLVAGFTRTVHHVDVFADQRLTALQDRAIAKADHHGVVSRLWQETLATGYGIAATFVGNGVDRERFDPRPKPGDRALRDRLGLGPGPVLLAIGGVEERKNTVRLLQAFASLVAERPDAQLVLAGGSSLLDHGAYQARFAALLAASALPPQAVRRLGPVADPDMPALYRLADVVVFPSVKEGFGLVVLEAMASAVPVVVSRIRPFTDYLGEDDAVWCDPDSVESIATAIRAALDPGPRGRLAARGPVVAARHDWAAVAQAHLSLYARTKELTHA